MAPRLDGALGHAQPDDRQRAGGAGYDHIVLGKALADLVELDGVAREARRQCLAAFQRAVGDGEPLRFARGKVRSAQFDHFTGADEQHLLFGNVLEDALGQVYGCRRHRYDVGADGGSGAHLLRHGEGLLEQLVQQRAHRAGILRHACRMLHLAEDLRLAQHHRIEAAGDAEHVPHGIAAGQCVEVRGNLLRQQLMIFGQPLRRRFGRFCGAIQLGAVAGRQDRRLAHFTAMRQFDQRLRQTHRIERHLFAHGKRRGMVVETEGIKLHWRRSGRNYPRKL